MIGWAKVKLAARYAGVSERTFRDWLKNGLQYSQLPSGTILLSYRAIDEFLARYEVNGKTESQKIERLTNEILKDLAG